jgi:hypothetical protein
MNKYKRGDIVTVTGNSLANPYGQHFMNNGDKARVFQQDQDRADVYWVKVDAGGLWAVLKSDIRSANSIPTDCRALVDDEQPTDSVSF